MRSFSGTRPTRFRHGPWITRALGWTRCEPVGICRTAQISPRVLVAVTTAVVIGRRCISRGLLREPKFSAHVMIRNSSDSRDGQFAPYRDYLVNPPANSGFRFSLRET